MNTLCWFNEAWPCTTDDVSAVRLLPVVGPVIVILALEFADNAPS